MAKQRKKNQSTQKKRTAKFLAYLKQKLKESSGEFVAKVSYEYQFVTHGNGSFGIEIIIDVIFDQEVIREIEEILTFKLYAYLLDLFNNKFKKAIELTSKFFTTKTSGNKNYLAQDFRLKRWAWHRKTRRVNKTIVHSPRNIIDTGELFKSLKKPTVEHLNSDRYHQIYTIRYTWNTKYATLVHEGGTFYNNNQIIEYPARPYTQRFAQSAQFLTQLQENLKKVI